MKLVAAETEGIRGSQTNFDVSAYVIEGNSPVPTNSLMSALSRFTGTNIDRVQLVRAASALQAEYGNHGYPMMSVVTGQRRITNGIATLNVFEGAIPQIVVSGQRYVVSSNGVEIVADTSVAESTSAAPASAPVATNVGPRFEVQRYQVAGNTVLPIS
jgi:hemolysin activation/secretion protein